MFVVQHKVRGFVRYTNQHVPLDEKFTYNLQFARTFPTQLGAGKAISTVCHTHQYKGIVRKDFDIVPVHVTISIG